MPDNITQIDRYDRARKLVDAYRKDGMMGVQRLYPNNSDTERLFEFTAHLMSELDAVKANPQAAEATVAQAAEIKPETAPVPEVPTEGLFVASIMLAKKTTKISVSAGSLPEATQKLLAHYGADQIKGIAPGSPILVG